MANQEQLEILKQGVEVWNKWRAENLDVEINLSEADLRGANLRVANLTYVDFTGADLTGAVLFDANLFAANLRGANLHGTYLRGAFLRGADLADVDLTSAYLALANLTGANLSRSMFSKAVVSFTVFGNLDLSEVIGLDEVQHRAPSTIGTDTVAHSKGMIPEVFLRGCGLSDIDIEYAKLYNPDLSNEEINKILSNTYGFRANQSLQISPLFISYSHGDGEFVDKLESSLNKIGIRFWRDVHDAKAGRLEKQIDLAIRQNPTVLLVLSEHSIQSDWVEHEVRTARELEKEMGRDVLCPVALDDSWKDSRWPKRVMEQIMEYNILDFSAWKDDGKFDSMFRKLIDGLELFYKG